MSVLKHMRTYPEIDLKPFEQFVAREVLPRSDKQDELGEFDHNMAKRMHELGVLKAITPKKHGGLEYPLADLIWIARRFGSGSGGIGGTFIGNLLGYSVMVLYGQENIQKEIFKRVLNDYALWSFAMTERGCGSDLEKIKTKAIKTQDGYVISGEKNFITNASYSTDISLFAHAYTEDGVSLGISCFYIPGNSKGLTRGAGEKKLGWRESNTGHLFLKDVVVPHSHLLGKEGEGIQILTHCLNRSKTLMGAVGIGTSDRALQITLERLQQTERFDRPLIEKHSIRHHISRLFMKLESAWLLVARAAAHFDSNLETVKESSMAKLAAGEAVTEITGKCVELSGAHGYLSSSEIQRLYRDSKAIEIVEGSNLIQELLISKYVIPKKAKTELKKTG